MKRRKFIAEFKTKVAIEAIRGLKTLNEISSEYEIHPNQVTKCLEEVSLREKETIDSSATDIQGQEE